MTDESILEAIIEMARDTLGHFLEVYDKLQKYKRYRIAGEKLLEYVNPGERILVEEFNRRYFDEAIVTYREVQSVQIEGLKIVHQYLQGENPFEKNPAVLEKMAKMEEELPSKRVEAAKQIELAEQGFYKQLRKLGFSDDEALEGATNIDTFICVFYDKLCEKYSVEI